MKIPEPRRTIRLPDFERDGFGLDDAEKRQAEFSEFRIPDLSERQTLRPGDYAKLLFEIDVDGDIEVERMWVLIRERTENGYVGSLANNAIDAGGNPRLLFGAELRFEDRHIADIGRGNAGSLVEAKAPVPTPWVD